MCAVCVLTLQGQRSPGEENQEKSICGRPMESTSSGNQVWKYCCSVWYWSRKFIFNTYLRTLLIPPMNVLRDRRLWPLAHPVILLDLSPPAIKPFVFAFIHPVLQAVLVKGRIWGSTLMWLFPSFFRYLLLTGHLPGTAGGAWHP